MIPAGATPFAAFGVFDGHGGKQSATFASKNLLPTVTKFLDRCAGEAPGAAASKLQGANPEDVAVWTAQEGLIERLPKVLLRVLPQLRLRNLRALGLTSETCLRWTCRVAGFSYVPEVAR